jgi:uncharacterized membrane protein YfcA
MDMLSLLLVSVPVGFIGSLTGLGGASILIPLMVFFGIPVKEAIASAMISVVATSSGSASAYVRQRLANVKIAMFLEMFTSIGAIIGATITTWIHPVCLYFFFAAFLMTSFIGARVAPSTGRAGEATPSTQGSSVKAEDTTAGARVAPSTGKAGEATPSTKGNSARAEDTTAGALVAPSTGAARGATPSTKGKSVEAKETVAGSRWTRGEGLSRKLRLEGSYFDESTRTLIRYRADHPLLGGLGMMVAGVAAGMLGIGAGAFKVTIQENVLKLPPKVASTTSNFIIGMTALAGTSVYLFSGLMNVTLMAPMAVGTTIGALAGGRVLNRLPGSFLRGLFFVIVGALIVQMLYKGVVSW